MYARSIKFETATDEQEILELEAVKNVLFDMLSCKDEEQFKAVMANGIDTNIDIFTKETRIRINNTTYNDLIENTLYSTNNISKIYSVKSEKPTSGVIVFTMADK